MSDEAPAHMASPPAPVEHKVTAGSLGAGAGLTVAGAINWGLGEYAFHGDVPDPVQAFVLLAVTVGGAYWAAWLAPHTYRP